MILIAENDDSMRTVLHDALRRSGYRVEALADGQLVWPMLEAGEVELLILDLRMPGMNGWEVLRRLKDDHRRAQSPTPELPVIVISAQSDPETERFALRLGAAAFMAKPLDLNDLGLTVRRVLGKVAASS
jgi:two-component system nitrogen regulation response regulator GlnG